MEQSMLLYIHLQIKTFRKNFIHSVSRRNFDEIHDYRVALKRIQMIINFIKQIPGGRNLKKCFKINNLQLAFKSGGILREMQINRIILAGFEEKTQTRYTRFRKYIWLKEKSALRNLQITRGKFSAEKLKRFEKKLTDAVRKIPGHLFLKHIHTYVETQVSQINELVKDQNVETSLHRIRRNTKSIRYLMEISGPGSISYKDLDFAVETITQLEDLIGNWHDHLVFKQELEKFIDALQKRKDVDTYTLDLFSSVEKEYELQFRQTVSAIYAHYKIPARKETVSRS